VRKNFIAIFKLVYHLILSRVKCATMVIDHNLQFIEKKLSEIKTAVMYAGDNSIVKLPNDIVTFIKVDTAGKLWFSAHKPRCLLQEYEQSFPLRLFFYRKGIDFYVETSGVAMIAGPDDIQESGEELAEGEFLLKMTPHMVEFTETSRRPAFAGISQLWSGFTRWVTENLTFIHTKHPRLTGMEKTKNYG
jgi:hypothetical protein